MFGLRSFEIQIAVFNYIGNCVPKKLSDTAVNTIWDLLLLYRFRQISVLTTKNMHILLVCHRVHCQRGKHLWLKKLTCQ